MRIKYEEEEVDVYAYTRSRQRRPCPLFQLIDGHEALPRPGRRLPRGGHAHLLVPLVHLPDGPHGQRPLPRTGARPKPSEQSQAEIARHVIKHIANLCFFS